MPDAIKRLAVRTRARGVLEELFRAPAICYAIHYSCESFYDNPTGSSRRITSIAVKNVGAGVTYSFSIHQTAEVERVATTNIEDRYDQLEKKMLDGFYEHVQQYPNFNWLHWNMRDSNYGFPAIAHRYKVLGGSPIAIRPENLFNVASILQDIYGPSYIEHPRLEKLAGHNDITMKGFLTGAQEAEVFANKQFVLLHQSTLRKAGIIAKIAKRQWQGTLKTKATPL